MVALVLTLIAAPAAAGSLIIETAAMLAKRLPGAAPDWLASGEACDLVFEGGDPSAAEAMARQEVADAPIDVVVQPAARRRKRLFVADLESTIIENEMLEELAEFVGLRVLVAEITRRAMNGELDFAAALAERVALLNGLPATVLEEAAARIRLMPGARALLATLRAQGVRTALVSGGFTVFAKRVAADLGFDRVVANRLELVDGNIAGTVAEPIVGRDTKRETLLALAAEYGLPMSATLAVGDGANDLPMLLEAGLGVAFRAKPAVAAAARWRLDHADLTGLLYAQGYRREEIAESPTAHSRR
jgi:phosphoserine phosphatase